MLFRSLDGCDVCTIELIAGQINPRSCRVLGYRCCLRRRVQAIQHQRLQGFDGLIREQVEAAGLRRLLLQTIDHSTNAWVLMLPVRRKPEDARCGARRRTIQLVVALQLDDGTFFTFGYEAVVCANEMDRHFRGPQRVEHAFAHTRSIDAVVFRGEVLSRAHLNILLARPSQAGPGR